MCIQYSIHPWPLVLQPGLKLEFVYGYAGVENTASNIFLTGDGKLVYYQAAVGVVYDPATHTQRFFQVCRDASPAATWVSARILRCPSGHFHRALWMACTPLSSKLEPTHRTAEPPFPQPTLIPCRVLPHPHLGPRRRHPLPGHPPRPLHRGHRPGGFLPGRIVRQPLRVHLGHARPAGADLQDTLPLGRSPHAVSTSVRR